MSKSSTAPSIRYISVNNASLGEHFIPGLGNVSAAHFEVEWALWTVPNWGDTCYYKVFLVRDGEPLLACNWTVTFSARNPPGIAGCDVDSATDLIIIFTYMDECPYKNETRQHPEDGTKQYYFYKAHVYFNQSLYKGEEIRFVADYEAVPTFAGSELTRLVVRGIQDGTVELETFYREPDLAGPGQIDIKRR